MNSLNLRIRICPIKIYSTSSFDILNHIYTITNNKHPLESLAMLSCRGTSMTRVRSPHFFICHFLVRRQPHCTDKNDNTQLGFFSFLFPVMREYFLTTKKHCFRISGSHKYVFCMIQATLFGKWSNRYIGKILFTVYSLSNPGALNGAWRNAKLWTSKPFLRHVAQVESRNRAQFFSKPFASSVVPLWTGASRCQ